MASDHRYHHGDLRPALIRAGLEILDDHGVEGITLRAVAGRAGVSHAAPYHHFADKARLIEALAVHGFDGFTAALVRARSETDGTSLDKLQATGVAYVLYAASNPHLFHLMNRPELRRSNEESESDAEPGPVERAAQASYDVLLEAIEACQVQGTIAPGDPHAYALTAWATVHGLAVLMIDGLIDPGGSKLDAEPLARIATGILGLGLIRR